MFPRLAGEDRSVGILDEHQLHGADVAFSEGAFAKGQIVVTHPAECFVEAQGAHFFDRFVESPPPLRQRVGIVQPDVLDVI